MEQRPRILLVDDDPDFVEATRMILEANSYDVIVAVNGNEGIKTARQENPDLILLDVIMPVEDGFTTAEQLKKDPQLNKIPVIMLTSFSSKGQGTNIPRGRGLSLEAEDYLEKPVKPEELLKTIKQYLKR